MGFFFLLLVVVVFFVLCLGLIRYAYARREQPFWATIVACCEDMLAQIAQEPDVFWLATVLRHRRCQSKSNVGSEAPVTTQHRQR